MTDPRRILVCGLLCFAGPAWAESPLSAIDWLSDSINAPRAPVSGQEAGISQGALPETIDVLPLGGPLPDAVGLFPASASDLAPDLWDGSTSVDIARRIELDRRDILPAIRDLLYEILLAELDPPADAGPASRLFLARVDTLLAFGALEQADALLQRAGISNTEIFRRAFDISLLLRTENRTCSIVRSTPALSPTFPARIFCLARGGDWDAAALTLETGRALGFISEEDSELLARFLEPSLADGVPPLAAPIRPSPLSFRLMEAIGEPLPTATLPLAFAQSDLHTNAGWKAQIEAAERLLRTGAIDANQLLGLYTERKPAASGGVWDRANAVQKFDAALRSGDLKQINETLRPAWAAMETVELEVPFARLFYARLSRYELSPLNADITFKIGILSDDYQKFSAGVTPRSAGQKFLIDIAQGKPGTAPSNDSLAQAVSEGFSTIGIPVRLQSLVSQGRMGEAILRAIELFAGGALGDVDEMTDALRFMRSVGLEDTARRSAIQLLLLERRG
ncbi:MAG: hypothetical protein ACSHXD_03700 [Marinosulfonomonas sp.]